MSSSVMFVCTGNTCRSPLAERLASVLDPGTQFSSTGTHVMANLGIDPAMASCLERFGGDTSEFCSRRLDVQTLTEADLIIGMTRAHRDWVVDNWPEAADRTVVLKPYAELVAAGRARPWAPPAAGVSLPPNGYHDDVADPYRLGRDEAERAAAEIDTALRTILGLPDLS